MADATITVIDKKVVVQPFGSDALTPITAAAIEARDRAETALGAFQQALGNSIGYSPDAKRYVGITTALKGSPSDAGSSNGWHLPIQPRAMIYDTVYLYMTASGTGQLIVWTAANDAFYRAQVIALPVLVAGFQAIVTKIYVPAGGTVSYEPLTGGNLMLSGFNAAVDSNGYFPVGGEIGSLATNTEASHDYGFGASGYAIEEAPAQLRTAAEARGNQRSFPPPKQYIIGTWTPKASELPTWAARGVNTVIAQEIDRADGGSGAAWMTAWGSTSLNLIRRPGRANDVSWTALNTMSEAAADAVNPRVLAWATVDEPDYTGHPAQPNYKGAFDPTLTGVYLSQEADGLRAVGSQMPVFCNLTGYPLSIGQQDRARNFLDVPALSWFGSDQYVNTPGGAPQGFIMAYVDGDAQRFCSTPIGMAAVNVIQQDFDFGGPGPLAGSAGKPYLFAVPTGRTVTGGSPMPVDQWRCLVWSGIINGACGHYYFPQFVPASGDTNPYVNDDTGAPILAEMATLHSRIAILNAQSALIDAVNGGRIPYRRRPCAFAQMDASNQNAAFITPRDEQLPGPFEGCEIYLANGDVLRLVLNLKASAQSLTDARWGYTALSFAAYEVKAFLASAPATNLFA
jgi:hypothetical protein